MSYGSTYKVRVGANVHVVVSGSVHCVVAVALALLIDTAFSFQVTWTWQLAGIVLVATVHVMVVIGYELLSSVWRDAA
jgi:hypothetical protein